MPASAADDVLTIGKSGDPDNIDPAVTVTNNSWTASYPAYERLVRFNGGSTDIAPEVAKSWTTSADMLTWTFTLGDVAQVPIEPDDFVYADPPYDVDFTHYSTGGFGWEDQERTAELLSRHRGPVILVNQATPRIERLYRSFGFAVSHLDAPRRISCNGDRTPAREVIATRHL